MRSQAVEKVAERPGIARIKKAREFRRRNRERAFDERSATLHYAEHNAAVIALTVDHGVGDEHCRLGWCSGGFFTFPKRHKCGGLLHADFSDDDFAAYLILKCDSCGGR